jgi:hypothetical protein
LGVVDEAAYLGESRLDELPVVLAGERAQQRDTFEAEDVCEGMLVGHGTGR